MPTLADYWRLKRERQLSPEKHSHVTFFDGPKGPLDRDDDGLVAPPKGNT